MWTQKKIIRLGLTLIFSPVVLAILAASIVSYYEFGNQPEVTLAEIVNYFYLYVSENVPIVIGVYIWHSILLFPYSLFLKQVHKFHLLFFLAGAYLLGTITSFAVILITNVFTLNIYMIPSALMLSFFLGGTYGFFQGYLSWFLAGFHLQDMEQQHATAH